MEEGVTSRTISIVFAAIAIPFSIAPFFLFFYLKKIPKNFLLITTLFVSAADFIYAVCQIIICTVLDINENSESPKCTESTRICQIFGTMSLFVEYYLCFWCAALAVIFIILMNVLSRADTASATVVERKGVIISTTAALAVSAVLTIVFSFVFGVTLFSYPSPDPPDTAAPLSARAEGYTAQRYHCGLCKVDDAAPEGVSSCDLFDDDIGDTGLYAQFWAFDIVSMICIAVSMASIAFSVYTVARMRRQRVTAISLRQYLYMVTSTLLIFALASIFLYILDCSEADGYGTSRDSFVSILASMHPFLSSLLAYPIWIFTIRRVYWPHKATQERHLLQKDSTSETLFQSDFETSSY
eukprot:gnl/Chilomastix_cuspidata/3817.p1 GENE.gnl/Chilomastix_cuspidata/3817~~gnl/Chilomastix_cuspidata/3817.p1  ORF type:complete len:355 (+),score=106.35 gnl/Chilomastix_cuspidata/3817:896-1960(+)